MVRLSRAGRGDGDGFAGGVFVRPGRERLVRVFMMTFRFFRTRHSEESNQPAG